MLLQGIGCLVDEAYVSRKCCMTYDDMAVWGCSMYITDIFVQYVNEDRRAPAN